MSCCKCFVFITFELLCLSQSPNIVVSQVQYCCAVADIVILHEFCLPVVYVMVDYDVSCTIATILTVTMKTYSVL